MGKRLYVGNLPYDVDEASLREVFSQDGRQVERVHIPLDRETQRPRGFAFIEFASDEHAQQAMASLDGTLLGSRNMRVTVAEDNRGAGPGGPPRSGPPRSGPPRSGPPPGPPRAGPPRPERSNTSFSPGPRGEMTGERPREERFGPDSRPRHERDQQFRKGKTPRIREGGDEDFHGRRGSSRFDDDDE